MSDLNAVAGGSPVVAGGYPTVGVNYVPTSGWFYSWLDLDLDEVRRDFDQLAALGLDHVRVFPLWPILQPNPGMIRQGALADVRDVAVAASERGLRVAVDVLQGHMSSFDFLPAWVRSWHAANIFTDPTVVEAQRQLVRALADALRDVPGATGLSLGNEIVQFAAPRHPLAMHLTPAAARAWVQTMLRQARETWPEGTHTFSYDEDLFFEARLPFTPQCIADGDVATVHSWVFGKVGQTYGPDHPRLALYARYLLELARAWAPGMRLWLQEVGAPRTYIAPDHLEGFVRSTLTQAAAVPENDAITWWCSANVPRSLTGFPEVEYSLGLLDSDRHVTATGRAVAEWIAAPERAAMGTGPLTIPGPTVPGARDVVAPGGEIFDRWAHAIECGVPVTLEAA
ncbi:glycoside hydrolase 5 family protein [Neoactinobaculum massilliense]|uniref:glycoside hydrolase 5 family protein n=1 Tax=Neoactinobaculum massilliense TaxID=2364794 RepID=UPI000F51F400|nr:hypothetical protein [Neoactinobaculum massilliense]